MKVKLKICRTKENSQMKKQILPLKFKQNDGENKWAKNKQDIFQASAICRISPVPLKNTWAYHLRNTEEESNQS